ncbi:hypothetical protein KRM28CT15_53350 [Krasilnikovia sp. M28-CT-15]
MTLGHMGYLASALGDTAARTELAMLILGLILLLLGIFLHVSILYTIGIILLIVGAVFWILGSVGRPIAGRKHWY